MPLPIPAAREEGTTRTTEVPLYWREDGPADGDAFVLLHVGTGAHHDYMYPQMLFLAEQHRVITYDQRGGGRSRTDDRAPITWQVQVGDLARVLDEFALQRPTLVGYSWGGLLAMLYATRMAADNLPAIGRLILISPAPPTRIWRAEFESTLAARNKSGAINQMRNELAQSGLRERDVDAYRQRAFELSVAGYFANPELASNLTPFRVMGRVQQSVWESLGDYDILPNLEPVHVPSLVVHGRHDPIPVASAEAVAQRLRATFVVLEDCGHVPYVEQPELLRTTVQQWLATTPAD